MKRKILIGIIIFIVILILISLIIWKNIDSKLTMSYSNNEEESIEYSKLNYSEEVEQKIIDSNKKLIEEYENRAQNDPSLSSEPLSQEELEQSRTEDKAISNQKQKENEEFTQKVLDIVGRFYKNDVDKILQDAKKHEEEMTSETYVAISEPECRLVELVIDVIKNKSISTEEANHLKEYLRGTDFKLKEIGNTELLEKVNNIL